jgi:ribosomal-protein-alanine N-acetyltransferase
MPRPAETTLETARLQLRRMTADDAGALLAIFSDPKVMAAFGGELFDQARMEHWVARNLGHQAEYGYGLYAVILKRSGQLIGDCGLEQMELDGGPAAELGYDFRSDCWNQGYGTEAAAAVRDYAVHTLRLPRLVSLIRMGNGASRRVAEKIGMRLLGTLTRHGRDYWEYGLEAGARG